MEELNLSQIIRRDALYTLCKEVHEHLIRRFDSDTLLPAEGAYISLTLNDLAQAHDVSEGSYDPFLLFS